MFSKLVMAALIVAVLMSAAVSARADWMVRDYYEFPCDEQVRGGILGPEHCIGLDDPASWPIYFEHCTHSVGNEFIGESREIGGIQTPWEGILSGWVMCVNSLPAWLTRGESSFKLPTPPEVPFIVLSDLVEAMVGETITEMPGVYWVVETTTFARYDYREEARLKIKRFDKESLQPVGMYEDCDLQSDGNWLCN